MKNDLIADVNPNDTLSLLEEPRDRCEAIFEWIKL